MRDQLAETIVGFIVLVVAGAFLVYSLGGQSGAAGGAPYRAEFPFVDGLNVGADVRMAGVPVGRVTGIEFDQEAFAPVVSFTVRRDISVDDAATLSFKTEGLLGGVYLDLLLGAGDVLEPGETLPEVHQPPINVIDLLFEIFGDATS